MMDFGNFKNDLVVQLFRDKIGPRHSDNSPTNKVLRHIKTESSSFDYDDEPQSSTSSWPSQSTMLSPSNAVTVIASLYYIKALKINIIA